MASITFQNVVKTYPGSVTVVPNLNLDVKDKEFMVLVGPSGCGKSTTLRMIAGLEEITGGDLYIGQKRVNQIPPKDRDIAMVFQNYALYPHMTVYKNMAFGLAQRKVPKKEIHEKVMDAAKILNLQSLLKRKPKALSGGQRQRVALGRAMVRNPSVFLLDEPLSNLDAKLRTEMRSQISKLHQALQTTFVYVTHDQTEAMTMGDRICVMKDGVIQQIDAPQALYQRPVNMFVAGFIGSPEMNFIDGVIQKTNDGFSFAFETAAIKIPPSKWKRLEQFVGKPVTLGVRPEDLHAEQIFLGLKGQSVISAKVELAEMLGSETNLYFTLQKRSVIARVPTGRMNVSGGDSVHFTVDANKIHLFDTQTGMRIQEHPSPA